MLKIRDNKLVVRGDRLRVNELLIEENGVLENNGVVYTTTTVSYGSITGTGTLYAWWVTSEFILGTIDGTQIIIYYGDRPVESSWIQVMEMSIVVATFIDKNEWSFKD
jgi:hypothetical protein